MNDWCPTKEQIEAYKKRQRQQRIDLYRRADDGPVTILMPPGAYIKPPPQPTANRWRRWLSSLIGKLL